MNRLGSLFMSGFALANWAASSESSGWFKKFSNPLKAKTVFVAPEPVTDAEQMQITQVEEPSFL